MLSLTGLPTPINLPQGFAHKGRLYVVGGDLQTVGAGSFSRKVISAGIVSQTTNGKLELSLGSWVPAGDLPASLAGTTAVLDRENDRVYIVNGHSSDDAGDSFAETIFYGVYVGLISPSGQITWKLQQAGPTLSSNGVVTAALWNGYIYVSGADAPTAARGALLVAPYNRSTGEVGIFKPTTPLPYDPSWFDPIGGSRLFTCQGVLLSIGGNTFTSGPQVFTHIYWATINPDGSIGSWNSLLFPDLLGRSDMIGAVIDDSVYVGGGWDDSTEHPEVWRIRINGGVPETPVIAGSLQVPRDSGFGATDGKTLWVAGGEDFGGSALSTIEAIKIK